MKICLIVDDYMPHSIKVAAKMMHELAQEYVKQGHSVSVITPDYNLKSNMKISTLDGVEIISFKSGKIKNVSKVKRAINETLLSYNAWSRCKKYFIENPHDMIVYYSPSIFFGSLVRQLKKLWGVQSYLILRDIFPQWAIDNSLLKENSLITKYFKYFEKVNYDNADVIGLMSDKNLEWFENYYKTDKKLEVLYNWADVQKVESEISKYRKELELEDKVVFFYGGNMGHAQDMMNIIRLAIGLQKYEEAHFVLVGAGDEVELVKEAIKKNSLTNMTLLPAVNQEEFKQMLSEFDVGLFTLNKDHITHNFPGKLLGYMVQSMPILGSINPGNDLKNILDVYKAGYISVNGEDDIFLEGAVKLLDENERIRVGSNANNLLCSKFSIKFASQQILGLYVVN
jgi:glycosyltransferase involved in cell wall biosynthesis